MEKVIELVVDKTITQVTPELVAELYWNMTSEEQARFYNHLEAVADFKYPFQLQAITEEDGLTLRGRRVMQHIGEYSHWGITCKLTKDAT